MDVQTSEHLTSIGITPALAEDFPAIWEIFREIIAAGETYSYGEEMDKTAAHGYWMGEGVSCFVARYHTETAGCYALRMNRTGRASHVANASFLVSKNYRGKGIGKALGEHAVAEAKRRGFLAMQFNFVVSTNERAVKLWQSLGFRIAGVLPQGYRHKKKGLVDVFVMHRFL